MKALDYLDFYDIVAIILGIAFTIAKLDAQGRKAENFPHVPPAPFDRWQSWTTSIYRLGSTACFARVVFHQGWSLYIRQYPPVGPVTPRSLMVPPLLMDLAFLGVLVSTFFRAGRARELRRQLGIVLTPLSPQQQAVLAPETEDERAAEAANDDLGP